MSNLGLIYQMAGQDATLTIPRVFLRFADGDHLAALLMSQLLYWHKRATLPDHWIAKSAEDWMQELGMSAYQIKRAIAKLKKLGFPVETKTAKSPFHNHAPTKHYRVNEDELERFFKMESEETSQLESEETSLSYISETTTEITNMPQSGVTGAQESQNETPIDQSEPFKCLQCGKRLTGDMRYALTCDNERVCLDCHMYRPGAPGIGITVIPGKAGETPTPIDYQPSPHCEPTQPQRKTVRRQDGGFSATTIDPFADKNDPNAPPPTPLIPTAQLSKPRQCETCGGYIMQVITQSGAKHNTCACTQHRLATTKNSAPTPQAPPLTPETLTSKHIDIIAGLLIAKRPQSIRGKKAATDELLRDGFIKRSRVRVGGYELTDKGAAMATDERVKKAVDDKQNAQGYAASFMPNGGKKRTKGKFEMSPEYKPIFGELCLLFSATPETMTISEYKRYVAVAKELYLAQATIADVRAAYRHCKTNYDTFGVNALTTNLSAARAKKQALPQEPEITATFEGYDE
jgi:hypothetical protein